MATGLFHRWGQERAASQTVLREFFNKVASIVNRFRPWNFGGTPIAKAKRSHKYGTVPFGGGDNTISQAWTYGSPFEFARHTMGTDGWARGLALSVDASFVVDPSRPDEPSYINGQIRFTVKRDGVVMLRHEVDVQESKLYVDAYESDGFQFAAGEVLTFEVEQSGILFLGGIELPWGAMLLLHPELATL